MMSNFIGWPKPGHGYCGNIFLHTVHTYIICWIWPKWESCIGWLTDVESCLLSLTVRRSQHSGDGGLGLCRLPWPVACRLQEEEGAQFYTQQQQSTGQRQTAAPDSAPRHRWDKRFSWVLNGIRSAAKGRVDRCPARAAAAVSAADPTFRPEYSAHSQQRVNS